jgi:hypothetical protein
MQLARKLRVFLLTLFAVTVVHAAGQEQSGSLQSNKIPPITAEQAPALNNCFIGASMAFYLAISKQRGVSLEVAERSAPNKAMAAIADTVWNETFPAPMDYGLNFYQTCSTPYIDVHSKAFVATKFCVQNGFLTLIARESKKAGIPKEKVYSEYQAYLREPLAGKAIDAAYEPLVDDSDIFVKTFNSCLSPLVGK